MAVSITTKGNDFKIDDGIDIKYYPADDVQQRVIGDNVELYLNGELFASFKSADFTTPTGTAEAISDAISDLSVVATSGGGGGGDSSAANQVLEIAELTDINTELDSQATAANQVLEIAQLTAQTALLAKSNHNKLMTEANDLVHTYTWLDGGAADQRISTIVYSSSALSLAVTETFTYNGSSGTYHVATSTLS